LFVTNAVLCNPKDVRGNNATPTKTEIANCRKFLKRQIDLVDPLIVVSLGAAALTALSAVCDHELSLRSSVRTAHKWYNRILIPAYHPGQRAMIHRPYDEQLLDYRFVADELSRNVSRRREYSCEGRFSTITIADAITRLRPELSYFALHKLFYMI